MKMKTLFIFTLFTLLYVTLAYPSGAPGGACGNLNPDSHGPSTATGTPPYTVTFSSNKYKSKQIITVTLKGTGGSEFKGFLIEGFKATGGSTDPVGFFQNAPKGTQLLCVSKGGNGMTHTNNTIKSSVELTWQAPETSVGDVIFHYTVVRGGAPSTKSDPADYFMDVKSATLSPAKNVLKFVPEVKIMQVGENDRNVDLPNDVSLENILLGKSFN